MDYNETVELEKNIKLKAEAEKICRDFRNNVILKVKNYQGKGRFILWKDSHNKIYVDVDGNDPVFRCRFLHETYDVIVNPSSVFSGLKSDYRGVQHLKTHARRAD